MNYHEAFIRLYGAYGAAMDELDNKNYALCREILKQAIDEVENVPLVDFARDNVKE